MDRIEIRISVEFNWMLFLLFGFPNVLHTFFSATVILRVARVQLHEKMEKYNRRTNASKSNLPGARKNSENERTYPNGNEQSRSDMPDNLREFCVFNTFTRLKCASDYLQANRIRPNIITLSEECSQLKYFRVHVEMHRFFFYFVISNSESLQECNYFT